MKRSITCSLVAFLAFFIGVTSSASLRQPVPQPVPPKEDLQLISPKPEVKVAELPSEEDFQVTEDERRLGIRHYIRPRSQYSGTFGRLSEFVDLKGKSKRNTFHISQIEAVDEQCDEKSNYVCSYVYVYWKEDNSILILYPPFDKEDNTYYEWVYLMRRIDLVEDVVPTWNEVGTTNYLVPKVEAQEIIRKCFASGIKIVIEVIPGSSTPAQGRPTQISLIETGEFHGEEISAKSRERWLGLFPTAGGYALLPTTLKVEAVHDPVSDENSRIKTGKKVSVNRATKPVFLLKGANMLKRGAVTAVSSDDKNLGNGETINLKLGDNHYQLKVVSNDPTPASHLMPNSKLLLTVGEVSQLLFSVAEHDDAGWALLWAGDLDGDGKLDLYMDLNTHYNTSQRRLFLSTQATSGKLVKEVAVFSTAGC